MAPIAKETEVVTPPAQAGGAAQRNASLRGEDAGPKTQPVALEVPVSVNGARTVDSSDKREPFSESTRTVLVFGHGAVIRLSAPVAPGQLLFLTNEKTKKEVICQVVKSKNYRSVSGYVELEFTEPVVGFWGMRFPNDRIASQPSAAPAVPPAAPASTAARIPEPKLPSAPAAPKAPVAPPSSANVAAPGKPLTPPAQTGAVAKPATPAAAAAGIVPQRRASDQPVTATSPAAPVVPASPKQHPETETLRQEAARLQQQLSSLAFSPAPAANSANAHNAAPSTSPNVAEQAAAKIIELSQPVRVPIVPQSKAPAPEAAPPAKRVAPTEKPAIDFGADEMKIPSWLEPLARNAAPPAPAAPPVAAPASRSVVMPSAVPVAPTAETAPSEHATRSTLEAEGADFQPKAHEAESIAADAAPEATSAEDTNYVPSFGGGLLGGDEASGAQLAGSSRKGLVIGLIAAGLVAAAAGGAWYFRGDLRALMPSASNAAAAAAAAPPAVFNNSALAVNAPVQPTSPATNVASAVASSPTPAASAQVSVTTPTAATTVVAGSREPSRELPAKPAESEHVAAPAPEPKKPSIGKLRLYSPTAARSQNADAVSAPTLGASALPEGGAAVDPSAFAGSEKQPAAPVAVGGDVKAARLISSVPPSYPLLARTQHITGDVKLDALVDPTGRVTNMKVISGPVLLHQAAMAALRQWRYQPATLDGKPVPMHLTVTIQFRM
jgi:TonB family protein